MLKILTITSNIRLAVAQGQRTLLAEYVVAGVNAAEHLTQLNLQKLTKAKKPAPGQDKKEFYQALMLEAKEGPIFPKNVIDQIERVPVDMNKNEVTWLATCLLAEHPNLNNLSTVLDWARATQTQLTRTIPYEKALASATEWHGHYVQEEAVGEYQTKDVVAKFDDGYTMVKVSNPHDLALEGELMGHCVGSYDRRVENHQSFIFSLRDKSNQPHVTIELNSRGDVVQIQGKQNDTPIVKYQPMVVKWLNSLKSTNWISLLHGWDTEHPDHKGLIEEARMRDGPSILDLANKEGYSKKLEDAIAKAQPRYIVEFMIDFEEDADLRRLTKAVLKEDPNSILDLLRTFQQSEVIEEIQKVILDMEPSHEAARLAVELADRVRTSTILDIEGLQKIVIQSKDALMATRMAMFVPRADIKALQEVTIEYGNLTTVLEFGKHVKGADIPSLQKRALELDTSAWGALFFAQSVPGADIKPLEDRVLQIGDDQVIRTFASTVPGADIKALQKLIENADNPKEAFLFAHEVKGADLEPLQAIIVKHKSSQYAVRFAREIKGTDVKLMQAVVIKSGVAADAYLMAKFVEGVDVAKLENVVIKAADPQYLIWFAEGVDGANLQKLLKAMEKIDQPVYVRQIKDLIKDREMK